MNQHQKQQCELSKAQWIVQCTVDCAVHRGVCRAWRKFVLPGGVCKGRAQGSVCSAQNAVCSATTDPLTNPVRNISIEWCRLQHTTYLTTDPRSTPVSKTAKSAGESGVSAGGKAREQGGGSKKRRG